MALPSFFKRKNPKPAPPVAPDPSGEDAGPVQLARTRARRRLIGAVVLLAIGVIGFPMVFETQPRPLPGNIPIELPRRDVQTPRPVALPRNAATVTELPPAIEASPASAATAALASDTVAGPPAAVAAAAVSAAAPSVKASAVARAASRAGSPPAAAPGAATRPASAPPAPASAEAVTVAAEAGDNKAGRFVVQVGAYTDANALREVRIKVEKLGLKTYTQSIETEAGKRTRVRVGPFATRQEADNASSKLKAAGLPGNVLVL